MKHLLIYTAIISISLISPSCSHENTETQYVRSSITYDYTNREVARLRYTIKNTDFPRHDGYVASLLKNDSGAGMLASTGTVMPNVAGILAVHTLTYSLNNDYTLIVYQDHYEENKSPLQSSIVDRGAKIVKHNPKK